MWANFSQPFNLSNIKWEQQIWISLEYVITTQWCKICLPSMVVCFHNFEGNCIVWQHKLYDPFTITINIRTKCETKMPSTTSNHPQPFWSSNDQLTSNHEKPLEAISYIIGTNIFAKLETLLGNNIFTQMETFAEGEQTNLTLPN
jgi:hypothetical protein